MCAVHWKSLSTWIRIHTSSTGLLTQIFANSVSEDTIICPDYTNFEFLGLYINFSKSSITKHHSTYSLSGSCGIRRRVGNRRLLMWCPTRYNLSYLFFLSMIVYFIKVLTILCRQIQHVIIIVFRKYFINFSATTLGLHLDIFGSIDNCTWMVL